MFDEIGSILTANLVDQRNSSHERDDGRQIIDPFVLRYQLGVTT